MKIFILTTIYLSKVKTRTKDDKEITLDWERGRCFEKDVANLFLNSVKEHSKAKYVCVTVSSIYDLTRILNAELQI